MPGAAVHRVLEEAEGGRNGGGGGEGRALVRLTRLGAAQPSALPTMLCFLTLRRALFSFTQKVYMFSLFLY